MKEHKHDVKTSYYRLRTNTRDLKTRFEKAKKQKRGKKEWGGKTTMIKQYNKGELFPPPTSYECSQQVKGRICSSVWRL